MRSLSAGLEAHLAGELTTLATLWKVTRTDAAVYGFTRLPAPAGNGLDLSRRVVECDVTSRYEQR